MASTGQPNDPTQGAAGGAAGSGPDGGAAPTTTTTTTTTTGVPPLSPTASPVPRSDDSELGGEINEGLAAQLAEAAALPSAPGLEAQRSASQGAKRPAVGQRSVAMDRHGVHGRRGRRRALAKIREATWRLEVPLACGTSRGRTHGAVTAQSRRSATTTTTATPPTIQQTTRHHHDHHNHNTTRSTRR